MKTYNPPRSSEEVTENPLEIDLVYNVRKCGTCKYFWPDDVSRQPYGPFPIFDFDSNTPTEKQPESNDTVDYLWLTGTTRDQGFPNGEVMDGCRKAPIMTIGINPNLTAFAPGQQGASWAYPSFTNDKSTDAHTKYAYYYRYRSVYQEHFSPDFMQKYLMNEGQIIAERNGKVVNAKRTSDSPSFAIELLYDGDEKGTYIELKRDLGDPRYVLLFDYYGENSEFKKGDIIAAKLDVPADLKVDVYQKQIGYYEQFVPSLTSFQTFLESKGEKGVDLQIGEDVCQLDMVACASPHWTESYLGNQMETIVNNCVSTNSWAIKQMVQTKPAVLYLVGESSYHMFNDAFSKHIFRNTPLSKKPEDNAFTLFKETIDDTDPTLFKFSCTIDGIPYEIETRLIVTPHFSFDNNFTAQFRMSQDDWKVFEKENAGCYTFMTTDKRLKYEAPKEEYDFVAVEIMEDVDNVLKDMEATYPSAMRVLRNYFYNPHKQMAGVLETLYTDGKLAFEDGNEGHLVRGEGACKFCVNDNWEFPLGCPYGKTKEEAPPVGYLQKVAKELVNSGKP